MQVSARDTLSSASNGSAKASLLRPPSTRTSQQSSLNGPRRLLKPAPLTVPRSPITPKAAHQLRKPSMASSPLTEKKASPPPIVAKPKPISRAPIAHGVTRLAAPTTRISQGTNGSATPAGSTARSAASASRTKTQVGGMAGQRMLTTSTPTRQPLRSTTTTARPTVQASSSTTISSTPRRISSRVNPPVKRSPLLAESSPATNPTRKPIATKPPKQSKASKDTPKQASAALKPWQRPKTERQAMVQQSFDPHKIGANAKRQARESGKLNLANRGMIRIPEDVFTLYERQVQEEDMSFGSQSYDRFWESEPLTRLILSDNNISVIDSRIGMYQTLTCLDIRNNDISELPAEISRLCELQFLSIAGNKLTELPESIFELPIVELQVQRNNISFISSQISNLATTLVNIDLSNNQLTVLPQEIAKLTKLINLNIADNMISSLPEDLDNFSELKDLDLRRNRLTTLFPSKSAHSDEPMVFKHLYRIDATENLIKTLSEDSNVKIHLPRLKELLLGMNRIKEIPKSMLSGMSQLATLDLHENSFEGDFKGLGLLLSLERLDISGNIYRKLPDEIGHLVNLKSINFDSNPLIRKPKTTSAQEIVKQLAEQLDSCNINSFDSYNSASDDSPKYATIFPTKFDLYQLNSGALKLDRYALFNELQNSSIEKISYAAQQLPFKVRILSLQNNAIIISPINLISTFSSTLTVLDLSHNNISTFPFNDQKNIDNPNETTKLVLPNVTSLNLSHNRISTFPDFEIANILPALKELNLSFNAITKLPKNPIRELLGTKNLAELFLTMNHISEIIHITFEGLSVLNLADNDIEVIPFELGLVSSIQAMDITGNRFRVPRRETVQKGTQAIMEWLRGRIPRSEA
ncbi:hypothetical protein H4219_003902 [Mycoemilia scoparia]|uniref:Leucine-rich repeat-containing protein 40 n=1 Tax=Mycoemilia scoparia TaxID=417184 RepID=A0A9W7ZTS9_9FUNG|nr:hypothetical protein H4219_003902 [Mycoemilia scoparia]